MFDLDIMGLGSELKGTEAGSLLARRRFSQLQQMMLFAFRTSGNLEQRATMPTQCLIFYSSLSLTMLATATWKIFSSIGSDGTFALLPLCREGGYFSRWRMPGSREIFEPGDCLADTGEAPDALAMALVKDGRPVHFDRVPEESLLVSALKRKIKGKGWLSVRSAVGCPTLRLNQDWEEPEKRFNAGRRSDFRRAARRADELGHVSYEMWHPTPDTFDALFHEAKQVELQSWKREAGTALAIEKEKEEFFSEYLRRAAHLGQLRIAFLRIADKAIAMQLAMEWDDRFWLFKIGYDEAYGKCSPGNLLMLNTIGWAARRGLYAYEFLGGVEPWIANLWTQEERPCVQVRSYPFGLRGGVALIIDAGAAILKRTRKIVR